MKQNVIHDCKGRKIDNDNIVVYGGLVSSVLKKDQPFENVKKAAQGSFLKGGRYFTVNEFFEEFVKCYYGTDTTILSRKTNSAYKGFQSFKSDAMLPCDNYWLYYMPITRFDKFNRIEDDVCSIRITNRILNMKGFDYFGRSFWINESGFRQDIYFYSNDEFTQVAVNIVTDIMTMSNKHSEHYSIDARQDIKLLIPSEFAPKGYAYMGTRNIFFPIKNSNGASYCKSFNDIELPPLPDLYEFGEFDEGLEKKRDIIGNVTLDYMGYRVDPEAVCIDIRGDKEDDYILPGVL